MDSGSVSFPAASSDGEPLLATASSIFLRSSGLEFKRLMLAKFFLWVRKPIPQIRIQRNRGRTTVRARLIRSRAAEIHGDQQDHSEKGRSPFQGPGGLFAGTGLIVTCI